MSERAATTERTVSPSIPRPRASRDPANILLDALAVAGFAGFAVLTVILWAHVLPFFDPPVRDAALQYRSWHDLWDLISNAANYPLIVIGVGLVAWLFWKGKRREAVLVIVTLALVTAGSEGVKQLVHRPRPPGSDTVVPGVVYSYPSGHELEAVTILGIVALLVWRSRATRAAAIGVAIAVALFCVAVAVARVAINAHWPSDVLAGLLGGIGVLALVTRLTRDDPHGGRDGDGGAGGSAPAPIVPSSPDG
jgi:membrane-associated phospholipid phosphatase